ncbi:MAG: alpha-amylase family glycosyl hydrolase, partial [Chloroflexota bacterium]|nr:alpha-amylase family glycosyl hydrolase [Chloroflexota bacterium]
ELLMLWLENANPAFSPFLELFDDADLEHDPTYQGVLLELYEFFETQPPFGPDYQNLIDMLRAPAIAVPHSLSGQLEYIRTRWGYLLGKHLYRLLSSLDLIKEEEKAIFGVGGGGPSYVYEFGDLELEAERFSQDKDWMPNLVLIAKNSYVWLDQLSKQYNRPITRLDQIPDEELDKLARWGFSGLWLIGVWERSTASRTIKQMRGNPEAVASAYSLFSYDIAADLGGDEAYEDLRDRAWQRGIRLSSDMVPNHMGIDSRWLIEHPDWFISLDYSPFPSYSFNGSNLSRDENVGIYIEDHYFDNTDAAVVFKRVDFRSGEEKYIYHGNDGTSMPWNDTAQLNYLLPEVREAVIQTILQVARKFPIIRFDAAMTLAKKHYQRLWFPEPGSGGDIPSRADNGLTRAQFNEAFPEEFWREVVDRVAQEVPDTLLLAEAFWLMEGYFVRTLGMHRVYNSAFMNMLRDEKNQEYRLVIKNTLEFDPEILKRYVNFMNNPDERTAVDQFGKGDKYFGICSMMATLPGLPMFGHGQIEGYTEKYGMEYRRAYWDETPDSYLIERHEREIFPLLRQRWLFANVQNFLLYDFFTPEGSVNEDVFAYSNRAGEQRSLVVYHNRYADTRGWIRTSSAYLDKSGEERRLVQKSIGEGLGLSNDESMFVIFRDHISGLEYIRRNVELHRQGLYIEMRAYQARVFLDFHQVQDNEWGTYSQLAAYLEGRGVPSIDEAMREFYLQQLHRAL